MNIYWLSILDNASRGLGHLTAILLVGALILGMVGAMTATENEFRDLSKKLFRIMIITMSLGCFVIITRCFIPNKQDIIEAYIMIEGKEIVNAENADKAIKRMDELTERIIDRIGGKDDE